MDHTRELLRIQDELKRFARFDPQSSLGATDRHALHQIETMERLARGLDQVFPRAVWRQMENLAAAQRAMQLANRPLMRMRLETVCAGKLASGLAQMSPQDMRSFAEVASFRHAADIAAAASLVRPVSDQIHRVLRDQTLNKLVDLARPYTSSQADIRRMLGASSFIFDAGEWARQLGVPMIDAASVSAVARAWGASGILRHLREISEIDAHTLNMLATALEVDLDETDDAGLDADQRHPTGPIRQTRDPNVVLALLSILLTLIIAQHQDLSSREMEARLRQDNLALSGQVQQVDDRLTQCIDQWAVVAEALIAQAQPPRGVQFVAGQRGAQVRREGIGGAVKSDVLPGQLVTLVSEQGKWIEISYFDFATATPRTGWVLKKYFVRIKAAHVSDEPHLSAQATELAAQVEVAEQVMSRRRTLLSKLAQ